MRTSATALAAAVALSGCATSGTTASGTGARYDLRAQPGPGSCHATGQGPFSLPDPRCTPGASDPRVDQADIDRTICLRGYTRRVRPPERITEPEKLASMAAYGDRSSPRGYEYDHLIPLELGGAANDPRNLWPEPGASPNPKDRLERALRRAVCRAQLSLASARDQIATDWVAAYHRLFG